MSACRSCLAPVVWVKTIAHKTMPVDADPTQSTVPATFDDGNLEDTGRTETGMRATPMMVVRYVEPGPGRMRSHFASCPNRDQHRRTDR